MAFTHFHFKEKTFFFPSVFLLACQEWAFPVSELQPAEMSWRSLSSNYNVTIRLSSNSDLMVPS